MGGINRFLKKLCLQHTVSMLTRATTWPNGQSKVEQHKSFAKLAHTLTNLYNTSRSQHLDKSDQRGPQRSHLGILSPFNLTTRAHRERRSFARPLKPRPPSAAKAGEFM